MRYLIAAAVVVGVNLLPAFAPPTWSVLLLMTLHTRFNPVLLVTVGALSAASGRYALASVFRRLRSRMSSRRIESLDVVRDKLTANRKRSFAGLMLFAVSPIPSAQLFEGVGLMQIRLLPVIAAFFAGRLVSYSFYVGGATALKQTGAGQVLESTLVNPWALALEIAMVAALVLLLRVDWAAKLRGKVTTL